MNDNFLINFKEDKTTNKVYFMGKYMEIYIPSYYFNLNMARFINEKVETLGIFIIRIFKEENTKTNALLHIYKFPAKVTTVPTSISKEVKRINGNEDEFYVLKYYKNDIFLDSTIFIQDSTFVSNFIDLNNKGKLPSFLDYEDPVRLQIECISLHGQSFDVPGCLMEIISSEIQRCENDKTKSYRFEATNKNNKNSTSISIQALPSYNNTFSAVTFEDIDYQLIGSINRTKKGVKEIESPLEKVIKY